MKRITFFTISLFIQVFALNSCMPDKKDSDIKTKPVLIREQTCKNNPIEIYSLTVKAKNWQTVNSTERFLDIAIPGITEEIVNDGLVMMYLSEGDKYLALPFNYYQVKSILSFQPSYEKGHIYITIFGNFILNINEYYQFKLIVVPHATVAKNKNLNWKNYDVVKKVLILED